MPQRIESKDSSRYEHNNVHSSINHSSQNVGTTQVHKQMDEQNVEYMCEREYYSFVKRIEILQYATTWMNMKVHDAKWNKQAMKGQMYDSTCIKYLE